MKNLIPIISLLLSLSGSIIVSAQEIIVNPRFEVRPIFKADTLSILILGDVMMHQQQINTAAGADGSYDFSSYFSLIGDKIKEADFAVANAEFTLAGKPYSGYPCFSAPDSFADYLVSCGFDVFLAANNHIFDKGTAGAERTLEIYRRLKEDYGVLYTGLAGDAGEMSGTTPLFIRKKSISLALVNFTYGTNTGIGTIWPKTNYMGEKKRLEQAFSSSRTADYVIALPHWGNEYELKHSATQEKEAGWLIEQGADCIVGSHPHVVQDQEVANGVNIVYSLGNAVSNMSAANTQLGLMATIRIAREPNGDLKQLPLELTYLWCSRPGGYNDSYVVIPVEEFIGKRDEWKNPYDYEKMISTYRRINDKTQH